MIIYDLDVFGAGIRPPEAQAILVVDADAVLADPIALQCFEAITWRNAEIFKASGDLELTELSPSHRFYRLKSSHPPALRERSRLGGLERDNHESIITARVIIVKRDYVGIGAAETAALIADEAERLMEEAAFPETARLMLLPVLCAS